MSINSAVYLLMKVLINKRNEKSYSLLWLDILYVFCCFYICSDFYYVYCFVEITITGGCDNSDWNISEIYGPQRNNKRDKHPTNIHLNMQSDCVSL